MPLVEITIRKGSLTPEQIEKFRTDITSQVRTFYKSIRGTEPGAVYVIFREHVGIYRFTHP